MEITAGLRHRFRGVRALYGEEAFARFARAHVCVAGAGGVGSWAAEALVRTGVGRVTVIDADTVDESNSNRQLHTMRSTLGRFKAEVMKARLLDINPDAAVDAVSLRLAPDNIPGVLAAVNAGAYVDAIDDLAAKAAFVACARSLGVPLVVSGGAGGKTDPRAVRTGDLALAENDRLLARLRAKLRREYGFPPPGRKTGLAAVYSAERGRLAGEVNGADDLPAFGAAVCVTAAVGLNIAALVLDILRK